MCRSSFGKQEGNFVLDVCELGLRGVGNKSWWGTFVDIVRRWQVSFSLWFSGGHVRLP